MNGSQPLRLGTLDWQKLLFGLGIGLAGFMLAWVTTALVPFLDQSGNEVFGLLAVVLAAGANFLRKLLTDTRPPRDSHYGPQRQ